MEMYASNVKGKALSSFYSISRALGGLYRAVRSWFRKAERPGARTEAERQAEYARQNYNARATATWQAYRYNR